MPGPAVGYFQIRNIDSVKYEIRKNKLISQTYIADFKDHPKIIIYLPWQFRLAKTIDIYLDNNFEYTMFESRLKTEEKPAYLFINNTKIVNNGILDMTWADILLPSR